MAVHIKKKTDLHLSAMLSNLNLPLLCSTFIDNSIKVSLVPSAKDSGKNTDVTLFVTFTTGGGEEVSLSKEIKVPIQYTSLITPLKSYHLPPNLEKVSDSFLMAFLEFLDDMRDNGCAVVAAHGSYYLHLVKKITKGLPNKWVYFSEQYYTHCFAIDGISAKEKSQLDELHQKAYDASKKVQAVQTPKESNEDDALLSALFSGVDLGSGDMPVIGTKTGSSYQKIVETPTYKGHTVSAILKSNAEYAHNILNKNPPVPIQKAKDLYQLVKGTEKSSVYLVIHVGKKGTLAVSSPSAWALKFRTCTNLSSMQHKLEAYGFSLKSSSYGSYLSLHTKATSDSHRDMIIASVMSLFGDEENPVVLPDYADIWKLNLLG